MEMFSDILTAWMMICHAAGLCNILTLGAFVRDVVYDAISHQNRSWARGSWHMNGCW